jgi:hypothetical protein
VQGYTRKPWSGPTETVAVKPDTVNKPSAPDRPASGNTTTTSTATDPNSIAAQREITKVKLRTDDIVKRYGNPFIAMIAISPSVMMNEITHNGYKVRGQPNAFVYFPTTSTVDLDVVGISGLAISEGFYVDKLPFVFERYGAFVSTSIVESITTERGWVTRLHGRFKMLNIDGSGPFPAPIHEKEKRQ